MAVVENPDSVRFCAPSKRTLQAGILDKLVKPPATPAKGINTVQLKLNQINFHMFMTTEMSLSQETKHK